MPPGSNICILIYVILNFTFRFVAYRLHMVDDMVIYSEIKE